MEEKILHTIWKHCLFQARTLHTRQGNALRILNVGIENKDEGPDFASAKIIIDDIVWAGDIEIDLKTSYWLKHRHHQNERYAHTILHIVWEDDLSAPPHHIPVLELRHYVSKLFLDTYLLYFQDKVKKLPCQAFLKTIDAVRWEDWKSALARERLTHKAEAFHALLMDKDWEQAFWIWLARYMGGSANAPVFQSIAAELPISVIYKEKTSVEHIEALLFGMAGLLSDAEREDEHTKNLQTLYRHFAYKYNLKRAPFALSYLRMRPSHFPDIRLAQLSSLLFSVHRITDLLHSPESWKEALKKTNERIDPYWRFHYRLGKATLAAHSPHIGEHTKNTMLVNVFAVAYYTYQKRSEASAAIVMDVLEKISAEKNHISSFWQSLSISAAHAKDTQALLHLKTNYCDEKRCLECALGKSILYDASL